ncbi:OB-fold protein [Aquimarina algiphila]|uniref:tRNA_anti-like n=1 Tax=Aquimarina algiphila TaxID=2047982 RepID=A0A554VCV8_9FLAO|nr:hypothetical protein [Aquimarina algiphila]TSE04644.1 hypothetical protein FOF46_25765 [Aquimarina algiphila]
MSKKIKNIILAIILGITGIIIIVNIVYNKPHISVSEASPDITLVSQKLLNDFENNEFESNSKYLDKIIEVNGTISEINVSENKGIITLSDEGSMGGVICHLSPEEHTKIASLKKGQNIKIKGICTGYLMDVILVKCIIIN